LVMGGTSDKQVWITSFRTDVLDSKSNVANQQYMCHASLDIVGPAGPDGEPSNRRQAFTVSQGQTEIAFPRGFAMPIPNDDRQESLLVQVLNNNEPQIHRELKFKATLHYFGETDARKRKLIPLKLTGGSVRAVIDPATARPQEVVVRPAYQEEVFRDPEGRLATGHWLVPPGKQVLATELGLGLDRDTTVHFMWMHVHPYAESLQLRDETIDRIVWKGNVKNDPDSKRAAILTTDTYSSQDGLLLHRDHKYELIATYQNPTPHPVDAMASLWMYVRAD